MDSVDFDAKVKRDNYRQEDQAVRHSSRQAKMTEKGLQYRQDLLSENFQVEQAKLLALLAETDAEFQKEQIDCEDLTLRRVAITSKLRSLKETAGKLSDLGVSTVMFDIEETADKAVSTMNKIVLAIKHLQTNSSPASSRASSRRSRSSSTSSQRLAAAAEAAALKVRLEVLRTENNRQQELAKLELEESARKLEAERKIAEMKRRIEEEKIEAQLKTEEVRLKILDELSDARSTSSSMSGRASNNRLSSKPTKTQTAHDGSSSQISDHEKISNLRPGAVEFVSRTHATDTHLADVLTRAINASPRLPIPEPPVFTGDPLQHQDWLLSFQSLIESRGIQASDKIHYLKRYLGGAAKEAVSEYFMLRSENAFQLAKDVLEKRFGNSFTVSEAFRSRLDAWPNIHAKDRSSLRKVSDFLFQCHAAAEEVADLQILNDVREVRRIASKLLDYMQHGWNRKTMIIKRDLGRYPTFQELVFFVHEESEIVNDPVLLSEFASGRRPVMPAKVTSKERVTLNTHTDEAQTCDFCGKNNHSIGDCRKFGRQDLTQRQDYIKSKGLCFGCLKKGHRSKRCTKRLECSLCKKMHPTCLHEDRQRTGHFKEDRQTDQKENQHTDRQTDQKENRHRNGQTGADVQQPENDSASCGKVSSKTVRLTSMAVPVYLSSKEDPEREILTYALLDTMSDTTFILDSIADRLQATSRSATLKLTTLTDSSNITCKKYSSLRVRGFNSDKTMPLPTAYSRNSIPLDKRQIPTPETASQWPHLSGLEHLLTPIQDCPVGLLIGYNCPRALAPLKCVLGSNGEPFGVETELGWSIVGGAAGSGGNVHRTHTEEVTAKDLIDLMGQDFKDISSHCKSMSQEGKKFVKILEEGICHREDGFYEMPFPFRNEEPKFPDNRQAALQRVFALKKQFAKRPQDFQHCSNFMKEVSESGDAEKIPENKMNVADQRYKKHHGAYHPKEISITDIDVKTSPRDAEVKSATVHVSQKSEFTSFEERVSRFSSYSKLIAAVSVLIRRACKNGGHLSTLEINQIAERNLIRVIQKEAFKGDSELKSKLHPLKSLDPFYDDYNVLRVGGRLRRTSEMHGVEHPVILPKSSHLSHLIATHCHQKTAHQGRNMTMNEMRSRGYWVVGCRGVVSSLINKCVTCTKHRGKSRGQKMADLPRERVEPSPPFTYCGVDCFGPFVVKEGRKEMKRYGLIFTCLAVRAIHIEVLDDLTTDSFLNGLRCFIALRGKVRMIYCDQGTNFVGAKHELKENLTKLDQDSIASRLLNLECEFKFNPPSSSHMGGVWERQIRNVRNVLESTLDSSRLDTASLRTFMYEAMAIVNSRPLTVENLERADSPVPLTPNHILTLKSDIIMPPPPGKFEREDLYLKKRWRRVQFLVSHFWMRWKKEYLHTLQTRSTWKQPQRSICTGDIILFFYKKTESAEQTGRSLGLSRFSQATTDWSERCAYSWQRRS